MKQTAETHRIEIGGAGFGEASEATIEKRAREIGRLNGHDEPTEHDRAAALQELREPLGDPSADPEIEEAERPGSSVPPSSSGHQTERLEPDDEETIAEELVQEGIEEADHEVRVRSTEQE